MLNTILAIVVVLLTAMLLYAATKPDTFRVQRATNIAAMPEKIFPLINDFHRWPAWSPWEKLDPAMKRTHSGAPEGIGAVYEWDGNKDVGAGRSEIVATIPSSRVLIKLDFLKPFEAHNTAEFTLAHHAGSTEVIWAMYGPQPYIAKVMTLFFNMDKMVGQQFEQGLTNLKTFTESDNGERT